VRRAAPGRFVVDASLRPSEVQRVCGVDLPEGDYDTVAGLVMERLGRIPAVGDSITGTGWTLTVSAMDGVRVEQVELSATTERSDSQDSVQGDEAPAV